MNKTNKKANSCIRVLEFLKLLIKSDIFIPDLNKNNDGMFSEIEASETFLKYINTLYISGLNINKIEKKYTLSNSIATINFGEEEIELLIKIYESFNKSCIEKDREEIDILYNNISKFLTNETKYQYIKKLNAVKERKKENKIAEKAQTLQKYIDLKQKLKIGYNNKFYIVEPENIEIEEEIIYLKVYCPQSAEIMKIAGDEIQSIEILPTRVQHIKITETVVFEVYDRLSVNYRLRENEHIQTFSENKKVIINCGEDKRLLLKRLLKYGENCKVIMPKTFQQEYLKSLKNIADKL